MPDRINYIPSPDSLTAPWTHRAAYTLCRKVAIHKIKIDNRLYSHPSSISQEKVAEMVAYFAPDLWEPILVNEDLYVVDGQHRLYVAQSLGLTFIDVVVRHVPDPVRESSTG